MHEGEWWQALSAAERALEIRTWSEELRSAYEERAAIMACNGMARAGAEARAFALTLAGETRRRREGIESARRYVIRTAGVRDDPPCSAGR